MREMARGIDSKPYLEWLDDVESVAVSPNPAHAVVAVTFASIIDRNGSAFGTAMAEVHVRIDARTVLLPDVAFYQYETFRRLSVAEQLLPTVPPDLVAEVRSPNDRPGFREEKIRRYLAWGCPLVFDVDPASRTVVVHTQNGRRRLVASDRFQEFAVPWLAFDVHELFQRLDRLGLGE
jgi:hypothetical protein